MVKFVLILLVITMAAEPAHAQSQVVNWRDAGGDLFGRAAVDAEVLAIEGGHFRVPPLSQPLANEIARAADRHGLDPKLLHALVIVESAYRTNAVSSAGAGGLTQLMPGTAAELGVRDRFNVEQNLSGGADYLARQIVRFGDLKLALAAFNAGPGRVARLGRIPDIPETRAYVAAVVDCYLALTVGRTARTSRDCRARAGEP